jgi:hypothetical protein
MQSYNSVFSKENELKKHLKVGHKTSEHAALTYNFNN